MTPIGAASAPKPEPRTRVWACVKEADSAGSVKATGRALRMGKGSQQASTSMGSHNALLLAAHTALPAHGLEHAITILSLPSPSRNA